MKDIRSWIVVLLRSPFALDDPLAIVTTSTEAPSSEKRYARWCWKKAFIGTHGLKLRPLP